MVMVNEELIALPEQEQVSRGLELLDILRPLTPSKGAKDKALGEVDWNVIVKKGFIEVVVPACRGNMRRSLSDSELHNFEKHEMNWNPIVSDSKLDVSDASTNVSLEEEGSHVNSAAGEEISSSDGEADTETTAAAMMPMVDAYGVWWMPMGYEFDQSAMTWPMQWDDNTMGAVEYGVDADGEPQEWRTTVMIRNMPNNYTRDMLLELVDEMGFAGAYDFAYLPIDFQSQAGLGYAFLNFATVADAQLCFDRFEGFSDWKVPSEKVCTVTWSSPTQGLEQHIERYQNSPVMHHALPDEWKPILIQQGVRVDFPPPTKHIKAPKVRQHQIARIS